MAYWLMKTEPEAFSIDDLKQAGVEPWDGIRNYQARNYMRDTMDIGDRVLIYHSRNQPIGIVGEAEVASKAYPDPTQFQADSKYFDAKSTPENPRWMLVDIRYLCHYSRVIPLSELKQNPALEGMLVIKRGMRLSIQPVEEQHYLAVKELAST